jgi:F0F1-type ATP synthase membrane subunit b/b'
MVDNNQDSDKTPSGDEFPSLDIQASEKSSEEQLETPEPRETEQPEKISVPEQPPEKGTKPEKQPPGFLIRALRWVLGILIVFGLGAVTVIYFSYLPTKQKLDNSNQELQNAQQRIDEIQSQAQQEQANSQAEIDRLKTFESKNQELQTQLNQAELHVAILSAQNDVISAQLALEKEDTNSASLALSQTSKTLDTISNKLEPNQRDVVTKMKDRLDLAVNGIDTNTYAALSDLDVLYNDLIKLENTLFSQP